MMVRSYSTTWRKHFFGEAALGYGRGCTVNQRANFRVVRCSDDIGLIPIYDNHCDSPLMMYRRLSSLRKRDIVTYLESFCVESAQTGPSTVLHSRRLDSLRYFKSLISLDMRLQNE